MRQEFNGDSGSDYHGDGRDDCQFGIQAVHEKEDNGSMDDDFHQQHAYKSQAVADTVNVVFEPGHQFPGIGAVKKIRA